MKKITKGYYTAIVNGFDVSVTKTNVDGEIVWYNGISKYGIKIFEGNDFYKTKKQAFESISYVANHPTEYEISFSR